MKFMASDYEEKYTESPPSRGAWIEISARYHGGRREGKSPPSRGAWIEIQQATVGLTPFAVAPLAGGVD